MASLQQLIKRTTAAVAAQSDAVRANVVLLSRLHVVYLLCETWKHKVSKQEHWDNDRNQVQAGCEHANRGSFFLFVHMNLSAWRCLCLCRGRGFTLLTICHSCVLCFPLCSISLTTCVNTLCSQVTFSWGVIYYYILLSALTRFNFRPCFTNSALTSYLCSPSLHPHQLLPAAAASVFKLKNPPNIYLKPSHVEVETMRAAVSWRRSELNFTELCLKMKYDRADRVVSLCVVTFS